MKRLLVVLCLLFVATFLGLRLQHDPGVLTITTQQWTIHMPVWMGLLWLLLLLTLFHGVLLALRAISRAPRTIRTWFKTRAENARQLATSHYITTQQTFQSLCQTAPLVASIETAFDKLPKRYQQDAAFLVPYCQALCHHQSWQQANQYLKSALKKQLNDSLLLLYAELPAEEDKLAFVKKMIKKYPDFPGLQLCLGRLYLNARLFGQAKAQFEQCLAIRPEPRVYFYLGETLAQLQMPELANEAFKDGLQLTLHQG